MAQLFLITFICNGKLRIYKRQHAIFNNVVFETGKGSDQPTYTHILIRAFAGLKYHIIENRMLPFIYPKLENRMLPFIYPKLENRMLPFIYPKLRIYKRQHAIFNNVVFETSKGPDQPTYTHILIRAFAGHLNV